MLCMPLCMFWMLMNVTCHLLVKMPLWVIILLIVMPCYMNPWVLLIFLTLNSLRKRLRSFIRIWANYFCENDDLIAKLNESNKLVEKYKNLAENSLEKLKEFKCLDMDLDAKLVLFNKLVNDLKCENESLKMHAKCLITEPISKKDENICCNHVVVPDFVPIVCSTSKDKSVYIPSYKRNQKVERKVVKSKPPSRSQPKALDGSKFV